MLLPLLLSAALVQLPDAPPVKAHSFYDTPNRISISVMAASRSYDAIQTCHGLNNPDWHEKWLPTQTCSGIAGWTAVYSAAGIAGAWILHKTGHHKLERFPAWISAGGSIAGIAYSAVNPR